MIRQIRAFVTMLCECCLMSISNILHNRLRSFLTILGIMIGVTAVIALISTISGVSSSLSSSFSSMGAGTLSISITGSDLKGGLSADDISQLSGLDEVEGVTPSVSLSGRVSRGGTYQTSVSISGKNSYYFAENPGAVTRGRRLNVVDEDNMSYVCLIDQDMVEAFFYGVDPVGEYLYINGVPFLVAGLFEDGEAASIASLMSGSSDIMIPYTTALRMNSASLVTAMTVYLADGADSEAAADSLGALLDEMFSYEDDTYTISTMSSIEDTMTSMLSMMSALLAGIASIALLVGGIGIMNMMLTSVTERTSEIGLKKALGALPWQIQAQFLIESFLLSLLGGVAGAVLGLMLSWALCAYMAAAFVISPGAIALGVGFSAAVGIVFGWAPAHRASALDPIDALRSM
ncbi:MAG: ABC transporter permease [Candidatus Fimadaptatus sp.]